MGVFSPYYGRHFKDADEVKAQLVKDGIIKADLPVDKEPKKKKETPKREVK